MQGFQGSFLVPPQLPSGISNAWPAAFQLMPGRHLQLLYAVRSSRCIEPDLLAVSVELEATAAEELDMPGPQSEITLCAQVGR